MSTYSRVFRSENYTVNLHCFSLKHTQDALTLNPEHSKFDCRKLNNPFTHPKLRLLPGTDPAIRDFIKPSTHFNALWIQVRNTIDSHIEKGGILDIDFVCVGGRHRSVAMVDLVMEYLKTKPV